MPIRDRLARIAAVTVAAATMVALAPAARADAIYDWWLSCTDVTIGCSGSGTLTVSGAGGQPDSFNVTGATGSIWLNSTYNITGLSPYAGADNLFYDPSTANPGFVDFGGISFTTDGGTGHDFNIGGSYVAGQYVLNDESTNPGGYPGVAGSDVITFNAVKAPEPGSLLMMTLGLAGAGFLRRKRQH